MLATMAYNEIRLEEMRGERRVSQIYQSYSKAKGEKVTKIKNIPANEDWKKDIVNKSIKRKQEHGPGNPQESKDEGPNEELELMINNFEELLYFSDSDENDEN